MAASAAGDADVGFFRICITVGPLAGILEGIDRIIAVLWPEPL